MSEKISYEQYNRDLQEHRRSLNAGGKRVPCPRLADVDMQTVPPEKRGLVKDLQEREPR